jgi:toxin ParE1/3/4
MTDRSPVVPRRAAVDDVHAAIEHYRAEAGHEIAVAFVDALEQTFDLLARHSAAGSPRYAHELDLPGLRSHPIAGFPFLVFYVERANHLDVWRVLHGHRDIPESLRTAPDD